ncbi:unnamed protein product [Mycena citricolor]|uniref:C2H2-type domain-containing protein n=1 Tax=Mycena citricolor TaxID=2018698 RepID=A0AAD2JV65_9AGAR|nr:unnamed protein product [Mycena citricolor]
MSHPIAFPAGQQIARSPVDYPMGSYDDGNFNPSSYTRHFIGSPISWRAGSFGAQFVPSQSPTAMLVGSFEYECLSVQPGRMLMPRSPMKSPRDSSIMNAWSVFDRQGELCRNYTCCGIQLPDLHALLEHFEDVHIVVKDRSQPPAIQIPFNPQIHDPASQPTPTSHNPGPQYGTPFDTDDMDLGMDEYPSGDSTSPPPSTAPPSAGTSRAASPSSSSSHAPSPIATSRPALHIGVGGVGFPYRAEGLHTPLSAGTPFSAYSRLGKGSEFNPQSEQAPAESGAIAPALVFASSNEEPEDDVVPIVKAAKTKRTASPPSRDGTPGPSASAAQSSPVGQSGPTLTPSAPATPTTVPPAASAPTILLPHKPFRCPKPNCSKSYKQANGLKYHVTHGQCSFGPAKDVEAVRAVLEKKKASAAANSTPSTGTSTPAEEDPHGASASTLTQAEISDIEARVRPFACGVGDCPRRYKNMNGLRYHYQHSGDHGAVGLSLLAGGVHACLQKGGAAAANSTSSSAANSAPPTPSTTTPPAGKSYAWGSTLLPHIQATASAAKTKAKTDATPFTPPSTGSGTSTFAITPQSVIAKANQQQGLSPAQTQEYIRLQYAQYQQAMAAGWYNSNSQSVDVTMG